MLESFDDGFGVFTLPSRTLETQQIVEAMGQAASQVGLAEQFNISIGEKEVPFICDLDYEPFTAAFPNSPHTELNQSLRESLAVFADQVQRGWLTEEDVKDM